MNRVDIYDACCSLSLEDKITLRDDLNQLITVDINKIERSIRLLNTDYWNESKRSKKLEEALVDRLTEIKELKKK